MASTNTGSRNTGSRNTGDYNTGSRNTGSRNTGDYNTGDWNTGDWNTGNWNTGDWNTGDWNTGNWNTGDWNTGNWNTGYCNTGNGRVEVFGKPTDTARKALVFPRFFYHNTAAVWVELSDVDENIRTKDMETAGGYIKVIKPKAGWRAAWDKASDKDRRKCFDIPNWDNEMFKEISGIDVEAELAAGAVELSVADIEKLVGHKVKIVKEKDNG